MGLDQARFNMIEQQIRPWDVLDQNVLDLLAQLPRIDFVPEEYRELAYADIAIPLAHNQIMMHPKLEARMLQTLEIDATDKVLEIGTGSGYTAALMAMASHHVYSVDIFPEFKVEAEKKLSDHNITNITFETGDAATGWDKHGLYDVIAITGSFPVLPNSIKQSLNRGGRLFVVVGESPIMEAMIIRRVGTSEWTQESLFETELPMLKNAPRPSQFVF